MTAFLFISWVVIIFASYKISIIALDKVGLL